MKDSIYEKLIPIERLNITIDALARQDFAEADRACDTCPTYTYRMPDTEYLRSLENAFQLAAMFSAECWECAYRALAARVAIHMLERGSGRYDESIDELLAGYDRLVVKHKALHAAWRRFWAEVGLDAGQILKVAGVGDTRELCTFRAVADGLPSDPHTEQQIYAQLKSCWDGTDYK